MENLFGSLNTINEFVELDKIGKLTNLKIVLDFDPCFSKIEYNIYKNNDKVKGIVFANTSTDEERISTLVETLRRDGYDIRY